MSEPSPSYEFSSLNLLLFSLGGVCFGVDSEQIEAIGAYHVTAGEVDALWAHNLLGFGDVTVTYSMPTVLTVTSDNATDSRRIIIDSMEDLCEYPCKAIIPFPAMLEQYLLKRGMWGLLQIQDKIVFLIDFKRIIQ